MEKGKVGFENRGLVILLCVLVMAIVGLGIGIGVVMLNNEEKEAVVVENGLSEVSMAEKVYNEYVEEFDRVREIANGLVEGGMDSATPIVELILNTLKSVLKIESLIMLVLTFMRKMRI